jgi:hypothetical protein
MSSILEFYFYLFSRNFYVYRLPFKRHKITHVLKNPGLASARNFEIHSFPPAHQSSFTVFHPLSMTPLAACLEGNS